MILMRKAIALMAFMLLLVFSGAAGASEAYYVVKKGDWLSKIAPKFGVNCKAIAKLNNIKGPKYIIHPGQKLQIPDAVKMKKETAREFLWKYPAGDKFKGSLDEALKLLNYPEDVAKLLKFEVNDGSFELINITVGDRFAAMTFGKNKVRKNVVAAWKNKSRLLAVKKYTVRFNAIEYSLVYPLVCGNWSRLEDKKIVIEEVEVPAVVAPEAEIIPSEEVVSREVVAPPSEEEKALEVEEIPSYVEIPCPECGPELELNAGMAIWVHGPHGDGKTFGKNFYAELMYWENMEQDCSSEYWWGIGGLGSYYNYKADHLPSRGNGWRVAGEVGIKRFYVLMNDDGVELNRSWQLKGRLGYEKSKWENPSTGKSISQRGPVYGFYGERIYEMNDTVSIVAQLEGWFGFNQRVKGPAEWQVSPQSRTYVSAFIGIDYWLSDNLKLRIGPGYDYQGWDKLNVFAPQAQLIYDLPGRGGRIAFGLYGKFYHHINPTFGLLGRYENWNLIREAYGDYRESQYKAAGVGIGGNKIYSREKGGDEIVSAAISY